MDDTVRERLKALHARQGLPGDAARAETIRVRLGALAFDVPSPAFQRPLLARHDLHHLWTGYGTDLLGEAELGAWELGAGPGHWFVWLNNLAALALALRAPRRALTAYRLGQRCRSLYHDPLPYETLLDFEVEALRARVGLPPGGS